MRKDVDDDTIELMLSPEQMRVLSSAAVAADATAGSTATAPPARHTPQNNTAPLASITPQLSAGSQPSATLQPNAARQAHTAPQPNTWPPEATAPESTPAPAAASTPSHTSNTSSRSAAAKAPPRHWPAGGVAAIVGVTVVLGTLVALGAIAQRSSERRQVAAALPVPTPAVTTPVAQQDPAPPAAEPVRFKNPFDHSEVFEFPPGTSQLEAREAVAQLLMERARDRHVQLVYRKHSATRRAATERIAGGPVGVDLAQNSVRPR